MKEIEYKDFSLHAHKKNWRSKKPNVCQFELTFGCALHCRHCYTDCYNNPSHISRELTTEEIKIILDKVRDAGVLWVCFTGGDPLVREDFLEIYAYAKQKGFLITLFTNAVSMTEEIASSLAAQPPFSIEITVNAADKDLYEHISQVRDSYARMRQGLKRMLDKGLPLKIKTQITKDNRGDMVTIKEFIEKQGFTFTPSFRIFPRLNKDTAPCDLRLPIPQVPNADLSDPLDCFGRSQAKTGTGDEFVFRCAAGGGDGFYIDPYGNMFLCNLLRKPSINALKEDIAEGVKALAPFFKDEKFTGDSACRNCRFRNSCLSCPGIAYLEKNDMESPIPYFCDLAKMPQKDKIKEVPRVKKATI